PLRQALAPKRQGPCFRTPAGRFIPERHPHPSLPHPGGGRLGAWASLYEAPRGIRPAGLVSPSLSADNPSQGSVEECLMSTVFPVPESVSGAAWIDEAGYVRMYEDSVRDPEAFWGEQGK